MFSFRKNTNSSTDLYQRMLKGVVESSLAMVEVGSLTNHIRHSASNIDDLVSATASASEEMVSTVKGIADSSRDAADHAHKAENESADAVHMIEQVNADMAETLNCMNNLRDASTEIQKVVESINDISDQTNLLALNAAIEAARAGEAGRGFSVVAEEVRKLSTQSQKATTQITGTIKHIQRDIQNAINAVEKSAGSIKDGAEKITNLQNSSNEIVNLMSNIAMSTNEQSVASEQISESIFKVSEESKHNTNQTDSIMGMVDSLVATIEEQRTVVAELEIPNKILVLAQADHALWKKKIIDFQMGRINLTPEDAGDHTCCRLGKWYYGEGQKKYSKSAIFKDIEAPHAAVHDAAKEAAVRRAADPHAGIDDLVTKLEGASCAVVAGLKKLVDGEE